MGFECRTFVTVLALLVISAEAFDPVVNTAQGPLRGKVETTPYGDVVAFLGVPYAQPPVGNLRFAKPQPLTARTNITRNATAYSAGCMAFCPTSLETPQGKYACAKTVSEDCLYLNIWVPINVFKARQTSSVGTLLFIHGGYFNIYTAMADVFNGGAMAASQNIIVTNTNYRLNIFGGYFSGTVRGNFHLQDQRMAMRWINTNIPAFGGSPKITISGQSAGAQSVMYHTITPLSKPYFAQAIIESSPAGNPALTAEIATRIAAKALTAINCPTGGDAELACLRALPANALLNASLLTLSLARLPFDASEQWMPVVDGAQVPYQQIEAYKLGAVSHVPLMIGTVSNETSGFVYGGFPVPMLLPVFEARVMGAFPVDYAKVIRQYGDPTNTTKDYRGLSAQIQTDYTFTCPTRYMARAATRQGSSVFHYVFTHVFSDAKWVYGPGNVCDREVCHAIDLTFVFNNLHLVKHDPPTFTAAEKLLVEALQDAWGSFVAGSPNGNPSRGLVRWPTYGAHGHGFTYNQTAPPTNTSIDHWREPFCDFWDTLGYLRF